MLASNLKSLPRSHTTIRMLTGKTPFFASSLDQRFSFALYVPRSHSFDGPKLPLVVVVHGTRRQTGSYINKLKEFSDQHRCVILCPLFPAGIIDPDDLHNYKSILYKDIRFDLLLLSMIEQAGRTWQLRTDRFFLHGFSGGGQFAHRFFYLHPSRLAGISIGAPGRITPPNLKVDWPAGLGNIRSLFQLPSVPDFKLMAHVRVQLVVGENDTDTAMLETVKVPNAAEREAGGTRVERLLWLQDAWDAVGIKSQMKLVPGVGHDGVKCLPDVEAWLGPLIDSFRT